MATTNTRFFAVTREGPLEGSGYKVRVLDHRDFTTVVCYLFDYLSLSIAPEINAPGTGSITVDLNSPFWSTTLLNGRPATDLLEYEYLFEVVEDGIARFAFLGASIDETIVDEEGSRETTISGPGSAEVLKWACIQRPGWPRKPGKVGETKTGADIFRSSSPSDSIPAFNWRFPIKWPTMRMWMATLRAGRSSPLPHRKSMTKNCWRRPCRLPSPSALTDAPSGVRVDKDTQTASASPSASSRAASRSQKSPQASSEIG